MIEENTYEAGCGFCVPQTVSYAREMFVNMKVKINRNAAKELKKMLDSEHGQGKMVRVYVSENHGDHAHYDLTLDTPTEFDEIVKTDKDIDVLLDSREEALDGVWIQYFYVPKEEMIITNPVKWKGIQHNH